MGDFIPYLNTFEEMKVEFEAEIIKIDIKRSISMDKVGKVILEFLPTDETVDKINRLMKIDETVNVEIIGK